MNNTPDSPAKPPDDRTDQGGNYWTLFTPRIWKVLHAVLQTYEPGATVGAVAARHDVYPSLLRSWRRQVRDGHLAAAQAQRFLPVSVIDPPSQAPATALPVNNRPASDTIEIVLPDGSRVRVGSGVNLNALRRVVTALRG